MPSRFAFLFCGILLLVSNTVAVPVREESDGHDPLLSVMKQESAGNVPSGEEAQNELETGTLNADTIIGEIGSAIMAHEKDRAEDLATRLTELMSKEFPQKKNKVAKILASFRQAEDELQRSSSTAEYEGLIQVGGPIDRLRKLLKEADARATQKASPKDADEKPADTNPADEKPQEETSLQTDVAWQTGHRAMTQWTTAEGGNNRWFSGTITGCQGNNCSIRYDDGTTWTGSQQYLHSLPFHIPSDGMESYTNIGHNCWNNTCGRRSGPHRCSLCGARGWCRRSSWHQHRCERTSREE